MSSMMRLLLVLVACAGCLTEQVRQLATAADQIAGEVLTAGCTAHSNQAQALKLSTGALVKWEGAPATPLPIDPSAAMQDGDLAIVKTVAQNVVRGAEARDWIKALILGALGIGGGAGLAAWKGPNVLRLAGRLLGGGKPDGDGWSTAFVQVVDRLKSLVMDEKLTPEQKQGKVGEIARSTARENEKELEVQTKFVEMHHPEKEA